MAEPRYHEALGLLIQVAMAFNDDMSRSFARDGLTGARAHALWELRRAGPITQRTLADALGVTARTVTGLVDGMVATGFVTREPHPTDRRATLVTPTPHGVSVADRMAREQEVFSRALFGGMAPERFDHFVGGLGEILARFEELKAVTEIEEVVT
jgi:DNA-binding MarR family transcriptional regulator